MIEGSCLWGAFRWQFEGEPEGATACNCTLCRRYGTLWAYDYEGERVSVTGRTASYTRVGKDKPSLEILFCPSCACVVSWRGLRLQKDGRRRMAFNVRLAPPDLVAALPIDHFDGLDTFE